jgi:hypothetical protein
MGFRYANGYLKPPVKLVEVEKHAPDLRTLIERIPPQYGLSPLVAAAMVEQESGGKKDAIRYEPGQLERARKITSNPEQQRMYASSHCALQVMGWHMPRFNLSWADLYDTETCVEVSMTILKDCLDKQHTKKNKYEKLYGALACYNGSEKYAQAILGRLGTMLIEKDL